MIAAIIQARMGSTRLPGKVLKKIEDKTVLEHIYDRVKASENIDRIIIATTTNPEDDKIEDLCKEHCFSCFRGDQDNVLKRYYEATKKFRVDTIVRITADDPLKEPRVIDKAILKLLSGNYSYVSNTIKPTYPEGIDVEVFTFESLEKAFNQAKLQSEKEHVTPYIWKHPELFNIYNIENDRDLSSLRWTLDSEDDLIFIKEIYRYLYKKDTIFHIEEVLKLLKEKPSLIEINQNHIRNEGYLKSVNEENKIGKK